MAGDATHGSVDRWDLDYSDCGAVMAWSQDGDYVDHRDHIKAVAEAVAKEREACACLAAEHASGPTLSECDGGDGTDLTALAVAHAIRARSESKETPDA